MEQWSIDWMFKSLIWNEKDYPTSHMWHYYSAGLMELLILTIMDYYCPPYHDVLTNPNPINWMSGPWHTASLRWHFRHSLPRLSTEPRHWPRSDWRAYYYFSSLSLSGLLTAGDSKHLSETQGDTTNVDQGRSRLGVAGLRSPEKVSSHDQIRLQGFLISHCTRDIMFHIGFPKSSEVT